jgi:hypothetical protein
MEESPSDSGCSDGTKATTHHEEMIDSSSMMKNAAIIDLSKPLAKEEMLAIIQILRELWQKQFGSDLPDRTVKSSSTISMARLIGSVSCVPTSKSHYHSTPSLNKLTADLSDIKDKLKRFSTGRATNEQQVISTSTNIHGNYIDCSVKFVEQQRTSSSRVSMHKLRCTIITVAVQLT